MWTLLVARDGNCRPTVTMHQLWNNPLFVSKDLPLSCLLFTTADLEKTPSEGGGGGGTSRIRGIGGTQKLRKTRAGEVNTMSSQVPWFHIFCRGAVCLLCRRKLQWLTHGWEALKKTMSCFLFFHDRVVITFILSERQTLGLKDTCHHVSFYHLLFPYFVLTAADHCVTSQKSCYLCGISLEDLSPCSLGDTCAGSRVECFLVL